MRKTRSSRTVRGGLAALVLLGLAMVGSPASADNIYIDDIDESVPVLRTDGDPSRIQVVASAPEFIEFFYTSTLAVAQGQGGTFSIDLLEALNDPNPLAFSDRLWVELIVGSPILHFMFGSDPVVIAQGDTIFDPVIEDGTFQNLFTYFNLGTGQVVDRFYVRSDVPEPSTLALSGMGLVTLLAIRYRRRRAAAAAA